MSLKDFEILELLGDGSYSKVYRVLRKHDQKVYALKQVKLQTLNKKEKENALNEVRILASFQSAFIAQYRDAFIDSASDLLCLVMEYADDGDVFKRI